MNSILASAADNIMDTLPVFDVSAPESLSPSDVNALVKFVEQTGIVVVRDDDIDMQDNDIFLDMMEKYYAQSNADKMKDARPELSHQVGVTPAFTETSVCAKDPTCIQRTQCLPEENRPVLHTEADPKWRYMWKIGETETNTEFSDLNPKNVVPEKFRDEWTTTMDQWGNKLMKVVYKVTRVFEKGLHLKESSLTRLLDKGGHILAPTGSDIGTYNKINTVYAGYHNDISFLTIHGKSRFPGLFIWLRDGTKMEVRIPNDCLLLQVGKQLEYLTGGRFEAGFHEVICTQHTLDALHKHTEQGRPPWRVSSTLFAHVNSERFLEPMLDTDCAQKYPQVLAGAWLRRELQKIELKT